MNVATATGLAMDGASAWPVEGQMHPGLIGCGLR
jgi:hypothetical protein